MGWVCRYAKSLSLSKTKDLCEVILKVNVTMRSRVRERRTHGSVRGLRREPLVYSTIYSILYKLCIFKAYSLLNVQTLCIFPCFCPYEPKQGKFLFSADSLIQQSCGSTLPFPCSVSVNVHCGTDISVSEKFLHIIPTVLGASNAPSGLRQTKDNSLYPSGTSSDLGRL